MKTAALCIVACLSLAGLVGCGPSPDSLIQKQIGLMNEMADMMESGESDEEIEKRIKEIEARQEEITKQMEEFNLSEAEQERLKKKYEKPLGEAMARVMKATFGRAFGGAGVPMP